MNDVTLAIEEARAEIAAASSEFFPDLCDLIIPGATVPDGFGGETQPVPIIHRNIPCKVEVLGRSDVPIGGAQITTQGHKITMGATAITKQIKPHYQIVVQGHHDMAEQTFENPVVLMGSFDVFMKIAATKI